MARAPKKPATRRTPAKPSSRSAKGKAAGKKAAPAKAAAKPPAKKAPAKKAPAKKAPAKKAAPKVTASPRRAKAPVKAPAKAANSAKNAKAAKPPKGKVAQAEKAPKAPAPAAKAAPPPPPPPKKRKPEITPKQIEKIKESLLEQRQTLIREFADLEEGAFMASQSEMSGESSFDEEYADAGSFTFEREKELSISNNIRDLLNKVEHALDRIDRGTYGLCENCGDPINKERLMALPYSSLCLRCKQAEERAR